MHTYDLINMYYYFLYQPIDSFVQRLFANYDTFLIFKKWVLDAQFDVPCLETVTKENFIGYQDIDKEEFLNAHKEDFKNLLLYKEQQEQKYQVLFLAGLDTTNEINQSFTSKDYIEKFKNEKLELLYCERIFHKEELLFYGANTYFVKALMQIDKWPALLITKKEYYYFIPVTTLEEVGNVFYSLQHNTLKQGNGTALKESYFIQLSDLHLGAKTKIKGKSVLEESLDKLSNLIPSLAPVHFLITGDLMNSPNRKNMYEASSFMNMLKKKYHADVTFVLGNHDMIVNGFNVFNRQKSKVVAYLLGENIKVLEREKIILIKMNSTVEGNLARGKVGEIQLQEIEEELESIHNIEEYTVIALLHHHVLAISKDDFLKQKWHEKLFVGKWIENTKVLVDAKEVMDWFMKHKVRYVFHGHKHLPFFREYQNMGIISGGSSCGKVKENNSRYLSYNVLKYDYCKQRMQFCFIFYDDMTKRERQRIKVHIMEE